MPTSENAKLEYEAGQTGYPMEALSDDGAHINFTSNATLFSGRSGYSPVVRPDGLATGGVIIPAASETNDMIDTAALSCYLAGVLESVGASTDETALRVSGNDYAKITSVQVTSAGAISMVAGTDGTDANFVETRDVAAGPPYVLVGSIEIGQIRLNTQAAAIILESEIFQTVGSHLEKYDYPLWNVNNGEAQVEFLSSLPLIHTAAVAKGVFASYSDPIFAEIGLASDFKAPENAHTVSSVQVYNSTVGSTSATLGQGGFNAYLQDGVTDGLVTLKDENLWFKFTPDRYKTPYVLSQGKLGIARSWPAGDANIAACTISAAQTAIEKAV